ncbi:unnamed protein product [Closterium sp. Yama58-4]|nr:unnamed protein product [Closterium sp. Yama58-4]
MPSITACFCATLSTWLATVRSDLPLKPRFDPSCEYAWPCCLVSTPNHRISHPSVLRPPDLALGFVLDEDSFSSQGFNAAFHYASAGFDPAQDNSPSWTVKTFSTWVLPESAWPVKNQRGCGDCWAFAVVAAVEAAHSIACNWAQPPVLSVEHLRLALSSNCDGGSPTKALQFLLNATAQGKGLLEDAATSRRLAFKKRALASTPKYYGIRGIERTGFYGWFGLMLAVQRQPVIVHIEASAPSFQDYDGVRHPPSKTTMGHRLQLCRAWRRPSGSSATHGAQGGATRATCAWTFAVATASAASTLSRASSPSSEAVLIRVGHAPSSTATNTPVCSTRVGGSTAARRAPAIAASALTPASLKSRTPMARTPVPMWTCVGPARATRVWWARV